MTALTNCFTVICKHHHDIDACDSWVEFAVIVKDVEDASQAAMEACRRLVSDNGGKAGATMVIAGAPDISLPNCAVFEAEQRDCLSIDCSKVYSYRELN